MSPARAEAQLKVSSLPRDHKILDRGKGGDSREGMEAVVRWNDKRTSMGPAEDRGCWIGRMRDAGCL